MTEAVKKLYHKYAKNRYAFLERARQCAELSIPFLMPREGHSAATVYDTPEQSLVSRGINNLSSKFLLTLFPPNTPCFRLIVDNAEFKQLVEQSELIAEVDEAFGLVERAVTNEFEANTIRVSLYNAFKQLLCCGNVLLYLTKDSKLRLFRLDKYVVKRDYDGNVLHIIVCEKLDRDVLPKEIQEKIPVTRGYLHDNNTDANEVELYTHIKRHDKKWIVTQEVESIDIPSSRAEYPLDKTPWLPLRFTRIDGEDYGRGYVEEYKGDILALEGLSKAINEAAFISSRVVFLVNPASGTSPKELADTPNGGFCYGRREDVDTLQVDKLNDFSTPFTQMQKLTERLSYAFLLNTAIQRQAERVTAEEIRYMAQELESTLGGIYSVLGQELQLPLITRMMYQMERNNKMPPLPTEDIKPVVITGVDALGRGNDLMKLKEFFANSEQISKVPMVKQEEANKRMGSSLGIDTKGLIKTEDDLQQEQQQQAQQQAGQSLIDKGTGPAINAMSQGMQQQ